MEPSTEFILGQKLELWRTIGNVTMLWWVSAIVLCMSTLAAVWTHRASLEKRSHVHVVGIAGALFFGMIFSYGVAVILYIPHLRSDLAVLLAARSENTTPFESELQFFRHAMYLGTGNYILVNAAWVMMWRHLASSDRDQN